MDALHYERVTRYTRAPKRGKVIHCPLCDSPVRVYHFGWSAAVCKCGASVPKLEWLTLRPGRSYGAFS